MLGLFNIPHIGAPQAPSHELRPAKQLLSGGEKHPGIRQTAQYHSSLSPAVYPL